MIELPCTASRTSPARHCLVIWRRIPAAHGGIQQPSAAGHNCVLPQMPRERIGQCTVCDEVAFRRPALPDDRLCDVAGLLQEHKAMLSDEIVSAQQCDGCNRQVNRVRRMLDNARIPCSRTSLYQVPAARLVWRVCQHLMRRSTRVAAHKGTTEPVCNSEQGCTWNLRSSARSPQKALKAAAWGLSAAGPTSTARRAAAGSSWAPVKTNSADLDVPIN